MSGTELPSRERAIEKSVEWRKMSVVEDDSLVQMAKRHLDHVFESHDVPLTRDCVEVVGCTDKNAYGSAAPYGCGELSVETDSGDTSWCVTEQPDGYVIFVSVENGTESHVETTVRHELAHICGWETELATFEQTDNHAMWLDRLDGW